MDFINTINDILGPIGWIALLGVLGVMLIGVTVVMMMRQPQDPMLKLKRSQLEPSERPNQQRLRQSDRNEQLQKFAKFLEPENVDELSAKQLMLRQAGYSSRDAVRNTGSPNASKNAKKKSPAAFPTRLI